MRSLEDIFVEKYGPVKQRWTDNIAVKCPKCKHNSLSCNIIHGAYLCFHCDYGRGKPPIKGQPGESLGEPVDKELQVKVLKNLLDNLTLSKTHKEYLKKRGVYNPEKYGIVTMSHEGAMFLNKNYSPKELESSGLYRNYNGRLSPTISLEWGRIIIPAWRGQKFVGIESRSDPYSSRDDVAKYASPRGGGSGKFIWYKKVEKDFILTEGKLKAIVALEEGFTAGCLAGLNATKKAMEHMNFLVDKLGIERVFIIMDNHTNKSDLETINRQVEKLHLTIPKSCIVSLPTKEGKIDLDSFLLQNKRDDLIDLMEEAWQKNQREL